MNWDFHPEALDEYDAAAAYYAEHDPIFDFGLSKRSKTQPRESWIRQLVGA